MHLVELLQVLDLVDDRVVNLGGALIVEAQLGPTLSNFLPASPGLLGWLLVDLSSDQLLVNLAEVVLQVSLHLGVGGFSLLFSFTVKFLDQKFSAIWVTGECGTPIWGSLGLPVNLSKLLKGS